MLCKNLLVSSVVSSLAATATDVPIVSKPSFQIHSFRTSSGIDKSILGAADKSLFLGLPNQHASCDGGKTPDSAYFYLKNSELFLYTTSDPVQQVYVDRSGMGQGYIGYITGKQSPPRNAESIGWQLDGEGAITFKGTGLKACPGAKGVWSIWLSVGSGNPAGHKECLDFTALALHVNDAVGCHYSQ
ncbi:hypothetical protein FZEAL_3563 [Fusarium zealandicum]|uniref:Cell wall protein PhiA n=1 Tax=Fusarium zealandicum TaxID=1053134 RepID=A0A8H4UP06_9HYPO|nr:hypothetical protein FZEAL_3563 [Fusarium zealandicum]